VLPAEATAHADRRALSAHLRQQIGAALAEHGVGDGVDTGEAGAGRPEEAGVESSA
jgi:hypothetical protein